MYRPPTTTNGLPLQVFAYEVRNGGVYFGNQPVVDARWSDFIDLGQGYGKDSRHVFFMGQIMGNVHPFSFQVMDNSYAKDHQSVFQYGRVVASVQSAHFPPVVHAESPSGLAAQAMPAQEAFPNVPPYEIRDFKVFFANRHVPEARWIDFTHLEQGYGKDSHHVFFMGQVIRGAHSFSFEVLSKGYAKDRNYVFHNGRIVDGLKPNSFHS